MEFGKRKKKKKGRTKWNIARKKGRKNRWGKKKISAMIKNVNNKKNKDGWKETGWSSLFL